MDWCILISNSNWQVGQNYNSCFVQHLIYISYIPSISQFHSKIRRIETGKHKVYSEVDIIDGDLKAVVPSSSVRNYLDGRPDINLVSSQHASESI